MKVLRLLPFFTILVFLLTGAACAAGSYRLQSDDSGKIAAYEQESGLCIRRTETPVTSLRRIDRLQLTQGIVLPNLPALTKAMEDFCS